MRHRVGIVGFRGYSGAELVRLLEQHAHVEPVLMEHRADAEARPLPRRAAAPRRIPCSPEIAQAEGLAVVMLATPPEVSQELTPGLLAEGIKVVDLSGAYRLRTAERFQRWYREDHRQPELLAEAIYGLPEFYREQVPGARLVSNPGCYPTAANLALRPLLHAGVIVREFGVVCDAKSGVSGAGRKPTLKSAFCEVTENFSAYSILEHRHVPEVLMHAGLEEAEFSFTAQLLPVDRGILETIYLRVQNVNAASDLVDIYERAYGQEPFVRLYDPGDVPDLQAVQRTNYCGLGVKLDAASGRAVVVAAIDNLVKGAAGQAVQNLNLLLGLPETEALR